MATFNTTQKYLDYYGLQLFWSKVRAFVIANATKVAATHGTKADKAESSLHPNSEVWVNLTDAVDGAGTTTYTIDDSNINKQFGFIDAELAEIKANAGVTGIKVVDADNANENDFVKLTFDGTKEHDTDESFERGDVTITLDNSKLNQKVTALETADSNEAASRKADVEMLAGAGYTAGVDGAVGSWADATKPTYKTIVGLSNRLDEIDASVVTKVLVEDASADKTNYVTLASSSTDGKGDITLTLNDGALETKISNMDTAHTNEVAARKAADALIAGSNWNSEGATWTNAPEYQDITEISARMVEHDTAINALSSATHFRGVYTSLELALAAVQDYGDIVIINADGASKEYIYNADPSAEGYTPSVNNFVELGDTVEEEARLLYLENWVGNGGNTGNYITNSEIEALFAEGWALGTEPTGRK